MKVCSKCGESKPEVAFYKHPRGRDGLCAPCKDCWRAAQKERDDANRAEVRERNRLAGQKFRDANRERENARVLAAYYAKPVEKRGAISKAWRLANPDKRCATQNRRRATKLRASPPWANQRYIELFYLLAKEESVRIGETVHVDHIVPLKHSRVCGLHNEHNLQLLRANENLSKGNRFWPGM